MICSIRNGSSRLRFHLGSRSISSFHEKTFRNCVAKGDFSKQEQQKLEIVKEEYEFAKYVDAEKMPNTISESGWRLLLKKETLEERLSTLINWAEKENEEKELESEPGFTEPRNTDDFLRFLDQFGSFLPKKPTVIVDMWYYSFVRHYIKAVSATRMNSIFESNLTSRNPVELIFSDIHSVESLDYLYDESLQFMRPDLIGKQGIYDRIKKAQWFSSTATNTPFSELIGDREAVYITSKATKVVRKLDENVVYVLPGVAGRSEMVPLYMKRAAMFDHIPRRRLPNHSKLGRVMFERSWEIDAMFNIIRDVLHNGDWKLALDTHIPLEMRRNVTDHGLILAKWQDPKRNYVKWLAEQIRN